MAAGSLTGCGGGSDSSASNGPAGYCAEVADVQAPFTKIQTFTLSQESFDTLVSTAQRLQTEAPAAVRDDWAVVAKNVQAFHDALTTSGMNLDQTAKMQDGQMAGMSEAQMKPLMVAAQSIVATKYSNAAAAIQKEVKTDCHLDLTPAD